MARVRPPVNLSLTAEYADESAASSPWMFGLGSDIPLERRDAAAARLGAADLRIAKARFDLADQVWAMRRAVRAATVDLQSADEEIARAQDLEARRTIVLQGAQARARAGEDPVTAQVRAQTELAAARGAVSAARQREAAARSAMASALAVNDVGTLVLAAEPAPADGVDLRSWRGRAALTRSGILSALADYDLAEAALRGEIARQYPAVSIGPGFQWERGLVKLPFDLNLSLPPAGRNAAGIAAAEAARTSAARALETAQASVLNDFDAAAAEVQTTRAEAARVEAQDVPAARQTADLAIQLARAGRADRLEVDAAEAAYAQARLDAVEARRKYRHALAALEDAARATFDPADQAVIAQTLEQLGAP